MGWMISHKNDQINVPSTSGQGKASICPDYWKINSDGTCGFPTSGTSPNAGKIYNSGSMDSNFVTDTNSGVTIYDSLESSIKSDDASWSGYKNKGLDATCAKKLWADRWGVYWEGVSNANYC